jgi:Protein of unknown function DUF262
MVGLKLLEEKEIIDIFDEDEEQDDEIESLDLQIKQLKEISEIVISGTDWTTETILGQIVNENIQLNPRFQRRDAWNKKRKSRFIESIILGFPIPQIFLAHSKEHGKGKFIVLDGKQRLLTILQFYGKSEATKHNKFALTGLEFRLELNGCTYESIKNNVVLNSVIDDLNNQTIRTTVIRSWRSESLLHKIFLRLNQESTPLSAQELRQALHPGEFVNFLDDRSFESQVLKKIFKNKNKEADFRMRDVELLLRYVAFYYFLPQYDGNIKKFLDMTCKVLNEEWDEKEDDIKDVVDGFENAVEATISIFGDKNFAHVWVSEEEAYRSQFNRATLDVMVFYFSDEIIRESAKRNKEQVEAAFKELCSYSNEFIESVRGTTDVYGTYTRLSLWGKSLLDVLDVEFNVPEFFEGRIVFDGLR